MFLKAMKIGDVISYAQTRVSCLPCEVKWRKEFLIEIKHNNFDFYQPMIRVLFYPNSDEIFFEKV